VLDGSGNDITNAPPAPTGLRAFSLVAGTAKVEWYEPPSSIAKQPTQFNVYMGSPTPNFTTPVATVLSSSSILNNTFFTILSGLANGTTYQIAVRAQNSTAEEKNTNVVSVTGATVGPTAVENLVAFATN
jgi:Fibronectin type III domain